MDLDALLIESPHVQSEFWKLNEHLRHAELALQLAAEKLSSTREHAGQSALEVVEEYHVRAATRIAG